MRKLTLALVSLFVLGASACGSIRPAPGPGHSARVDKTEQQQERRAPAGEVAEIRRDLR